MVFDVGRFLFFERGGGFSCALHASPCFHPPNLQPKGLNLSPAIIVRLFLGVAFLSTADLVVRDSEWIGSRAFDGGAVAMLIGVTLAFANSTIRDSSATKGSMV